MILSGFYFMGAYHSIKVVSSADELPTKHSRLEALKDLIYTTQANGDKDFTQSKSKPNPSGAGNRRMKGVKKMEEYLKSEIERLRRDAGYYEKVAETARTVEFKNYNLGLAQAYRRMSIRMFDEFQKITN